MKKKFLIFCSFLNKIVRVLSLRFIVLFTAAMTILNCSPQKNEAQRPNIVFIMSDDHAYQAISAYNDELISTPNIDRIAAEGVLFKNSFVSNSICGPSRACILTGKYSHINGFMANNDHFDGSQQTLPKLLQDVGYQTAIVGKWHLGTEPSGFDYWNILPGQGYYYNPDLIKMEKDTLYNGYVTDITTNLALDWMEKNNPEETGNPFFLMLHHKAPHRNWMPPQDYLNEFNNRKFEIPDNFFDNYEGRKALQINGITMHDHFNILYDGKVPCKECPDHSRNSQWNDEFSRLSETQKKNWEESFQQEYDSFDYASMSKEDLSRWKFQRYMEDYLRCIKSVDDNIGRVLEYLDRKGLADNTILIYTSDQGFFLGEHGLYDKRFMYEEAMRTPMVMRYPDQIKQEQKVVDLVMNIDIAPTLLDLTRAEIPSDIQGRSMKPIITNEKEYEWRNEVYYHYYEVSFGLTKHYGIRTENYKLIHFYDPIDTWELYDLEKDPSEMINLIEDPAYSSVLNEMQKRLEVKQKEVRDTYFF
jgi:arylsulfatase A-like enzyme